MRSHTLILDMGGVLMQHNMPACIARFRQLLCEETADSLLGLSANGEGTANSLMARFERGLMDADAFVDALLAHAKPGTTRADIVAAWNSMHGGIPAERMERLGRWKAAGNRLFLLSNNNALHWVDILSRYDMSVFEHCFLSHCMHCSKPDAQIYTAVAQYLTAQALPEPYYFVDDIAVNRQAGERLGWITYSSLEQLAAALDLP